MIQEIQNRQEQIVKRQAGGGDGGGNVTVEQLAQFHQERGDTQLEAGNLRAALDRYQQALEYSPDNSDLQNAVSDLEARIQQREQQRRFRQNFNEGQEALRAGNYEEAQAAFEEAQQIYPNNQRLQQAIAEADSLQQAERQQTKLYERYRAQGDSLYDAGKMKEAIATYKKALEIRSDDDYVQSRIEDANQELEEMQLARQEMQEQEEKRKKLVDEDGVYKQVDQQPRVKGGFSELAQEATYPPSAQEEGVEGRVFVEAVVNADGTVRSAEIVEGRGLTEALNEEALRVVEEAEFVPAKYNGESVPARRVVFIQFQIQ